MPLLHRASSWSLSRQTIQPVELDEKKRAGITHHPKSHLQQAQNGIEPRTRLPNPNWSEPSLSRDTHILRQRDNLRLPHHRHRPPSGQPNCGLGYRPLIHPQWLARSRRASHDPDVHPARHCAIHASREGRGHEHTHHVARSRSPT